MSRAIGLLVAGLTMLTAGCATKIDQQLMEQSEALGLVEAPPASDERTVSLRLMQHPNTTLRIDNHGYPAWTWRGANDIGACVHIDPKTLKPYLETQYRKGEGYSSPKYIDFGTDSLDWQCRIHVYGAGVDYERNWSKPECHRERRALVRRLMKSLP